MGLSLTLVGCGAMGSALLKGWLTVSESHADFDTFWVVSPDRSAVEPFQRDSRVFWVPSPQYLQAASDVIVFAVKPSILEEILPLYQALDALIVSVAAGKPLSFYETFFSSSHPIARVMPNLAVGIHEGVIGILPNKAVSAKHKETLKHCFSSLGFCAWVHSDEEINKITALSGSGPAYVYYMIESFAQAAESLGFKEDLAGQLALHTFLGASTYAYISEEHLARLREKVTSPGGTTAAALKVLEKGEFPALMKKTVKAAYNRAKELSE